MGYVMTRISEKTWNTIVPTLKMAARAGSLDPKYIEDLNYKYFNLCSKFENPIK